MRKIFHKTRFKLGAAAVCFVLSLPSGQLAAAELPWQAEWERTVKLAETEGQVSFYTLGDSHSYVADFQKRFPKIKVVMVQGRGSELLPRIMAERRGERYLADVARIGNTSPYTLYRAKALQPIPSALVLPEVKDESKWWQGKHQYADPEGKYIFVPVGSASFNMVSYNPEMVSPADFKSYWDLLDPKWKGKLVVMDPRAGGYGRSGARFVYYNKGLGPEYLTRLFSAMDATLSRQYHQAIDWLAQKRFPLHLFGNGGDVLDAKGKGLSVSVMDTADWKEGAGLEPSAFTFVLMDKAPHPNAAKVFLNWVLSKEGQTAIQKEGETNDSLRIDIPKDDVAAVMRRRSGARYVVTWTPEWMNMEPIQKLVDQALGEAKKK
jgi:ABC-type Fe3+ transport system substrate-binding protein